MDDAIYPLTLYYNSRCPMCLAEIQNLMLRNEQGKLIFADIHAEGFIAPQGYSQQRLLERIHAKRADGQIIHSLEVFRTAYAAVGLRWVAAFTRWPLLGRFMDWFYPIFARNRHRLPKLISQGIFNLAARRAVKKHCDSNGSCAVTPPLPTKEETL